MGWLPLEGIRVIEFGFVIAGPLATRFLADYGAEVLKVESRRAPCAYRGSGALAGAGAEDPVPLRHFYEFNRNKRSITLDMSMGGGRALLRRLVEISDVILDNFSYGVMEGWGLGYQALQEIRPDIIQVEMTGLGQTGPWRDYVTWGPNLTSLTGMTYLWSLPEDPEPVGSQSAHPDYVAAEHAALAIMAALYFRAQTGRGQYIDLAQAEATASLLGPFYLDCLINHRVSRARGNRHPYLAPHNCYRCRGEDSWCVIAVESEQEWQRFCLAIGQPSWAKDVRFADLTGRVRNREALDALIEEWTMERTPQEVMDTLQRSGVAAAVVQNGRDLCQDRHLRERGFLVEIHHPEAGRTLTYPGITVGLSDTPGGIWRHAPLMGEDNEYVLSELLGLSQREMASLVEEGVLT